MLPPPDVVVGDIVASTFRDGLGEVVEVSLYYCFIEWPCGEGTKVWEVPKCDVWVILCRRCGYGYSAHAQDGKCLYGPGNWQGQAE